MVRKSLVFCLLLVCALPLSAIAENSKHHIGLVVGYVKLISDDVKDPSSGIDFSNSAHADLSYRYSFSPHLDLAIDSRATVSSQTVSGVDLTLTNTYFGPGVRAVMPQDKIKLFLQGNFYYANEKVEAAQSGSKISASKGGVGFGIDGGIDFQVSKLISIPVEGNFLYAKPSDNVSGFGISGGVTFNFGHLK